MIEQQKQYAISYQRFSSDRQRNNSSLDRQSDAIKSWLRQHPNVVLIDEYVDEAMSGWNGKHLEKGSLGKLLQAIEDGIVKKDTIILVEHFSRLSRQNIDKTEELLRRIWEHGITIATIRDNGLYPPSTINNMALRIRLIVEIEQAFKESEWRSAKVKGSYIKREKEAKRGVTPKMRRPFWLDKSGKLNEYNVVIKDIFDWYMEGLGQQRIIVRLKEKYPNAKPVQSLNPSTVMRWLQHDVVRGYWRGNKVYDAVVDDELFYNVQAVHKGRLYENVKPDRNWPLSGLMQCGICGGGMSIQKTKNTLPIIRCSTKQRDRSCKRVKTLPYFIAHTYMFSYVKKYALRKYTKSTTSNEYQNKIIQIEYELSKMIPQLEEEKNHYNEAKKEGKNTRLLREIMVETDDKIFELEKELEQLKQAFNNQNDYAISKKAVELVFTPRNFNIEMHKLGFRIVIGEDELSVVGLEEKPPKMKYLGYSRKTKTYDYEMLGMKHSWPTSSITEEILMLEGLENFVEKTPYLKKIMSKL
ncbi:recombinase family protein [Vibrio parahaemolyticus]|uniref:recombinase family protein n=1 Tax=Vibrio parahaemolyticus TaxID=670 RepID=UPI002570870D|nr:recombinase family protein [Vibrio parahaemolyticus]WJE02884.1 recombinase family protein [Vibrio parahaemolyticus]